MTGKEQQMKCDLLSAYCRLNMELEAARSRGEWGQVEVLSEQMNECCRVILAREIPNADDDDLYVRFLVDQLLNHARPYRECESIKLKLLELHEQNIRRAKADPRVFRVLVRRLFRLVSLRRKPAEKSSRHSRSRLHPRTVPETQRQYVSRRTVSW